MSPCRNGLHKIPGIPEKDLGKIPYTFKSTLKWFSTKKTIQIKIRRKLGIIQTDGVNLKWWSSFIGIILIIDTCQKHSQFKTNANLSVQTCHYDYEASGKEFNNQNKLM